MIPKRVDSEGNVYDRKGHKIWLDDQTAWGEDVNLRWEGGKFVWRNWHTGDPVYSPFAELTKRQQQEFDIEFS